MVERNRKIDMPVAYRIRTATHQDVDIIVDFNLNMAMETERIALDHDTVLHGVNQVITDPSKGIYFVAVDESDGSVLGQTMITYEWSDWRNSNVWWVQSVYVRPPSRRQGVFRALYSHVKEMAKTSGACGVRLYADRQNESALATYRKFGMTSHYVVLEDMF
jgi:GNAT superfamily N-acetyltransferase